MSRYLMTLVATENAEAGAPPAELFEAIGKAAAAWQQAGVLLDTGGLAPAEEGTRLQLENGAITASRGVGGEGAPVPTAYAIIEAATDADAAARATDFLDLHKQHWPGWNGGSEVRRIA
ncbi:hypothetical protein BIV57_19230 [Mangrovactinospora gilvigrisea]|uniref:YCII-related domain-containing protein n=1 Tax=Mangrovactinospora gilvigrisea TaxID=1428644 RepID=A0A1J7BB69_9ACTN|nr:hypothetical protein [Mangrovactinospora gilvigrisea]OIV35853.1 hypothetical protein BIV57_19230 [Mangrovactinospora gilvigrisea]